jgi:hypothetical protein
VFKRLFFAMLGLGGGLVLGAMAVRKAEEARRKMTPAHLADVAGQRAVGLRDRIDLALAAGREAALAKEAELRAVYRVRDVPTAEEPVRPLNPFTPRMPEAPAAPPGTPAPQD